MSLSYAVLVARSGIGSPHPSRANSGGDMPVNQYILRRVVYGDATRKMCFALAWSMLTGCFVLYCWCRGDLFDLSQCVQKRC